MARRMARATVLQAGYGHAMTFSRRRGAHQLPRALVHHLEMMSERTRLDVRSRGGKKGLAKLGVVRHLAAGERRWKPDRRHEHTQTFIRHAETGIY